MDPKTGVPKVQTRLEYGQLLKDVRLVRRLSAPVLLAHPACCAELRLSFAAMQGEVSKIHYVDTAKTYHRDLLADPEMWRPPGGDALVVYRDGTVCYVRPGLPQQRETSGTHLCFGSLVDVTSAQSACRLVC